jgi:hypothetical protein
MVHQDVVDKVQKAHLVFQHFDEVLGIYEQCSHMLDLSGWVCLRVSCPNCTTIYPQMRFEKPSEAWGQGSEPQRVYKLVPPDRVVGYQRRYPTGVQRAMDSGFP